MKRPRFKRPNFKSLANIKHKRALLLCALAVVAVAIGVGNYVLTGAGGAKTASVAPGAKAEGVVADGAAEGDDYFSVFRRERDETREKELGYIDAVTASSETDGATKTDAQEQKLALVECMEQELAAEGIIKSKLQTDAVVSISENAVSVVVSKTQLSDDEVSQIAEIVKSQTGKKAQNIKIMPQS